VTITSRLLVFPFKRRRLAAERAARRAIHNEFSTRGSRNDYSKKDLESPRRALRRCRPSSSACVRPASVNLLMPSKWPAMSTCPAQLLRIVTPSSQHKRGEARYGGNRDRGNRRSIGRHWMHQAGSPTPGRTQALNSVDQRRSAPPPAFSLSCYSHFRDPSLFEMLWTCPDVQHVQREPFFLSERPQSGCYCHA